VPVVDAQPAAAPQEAQKPATPPAARLGGQHGRLSSAGQEHVPDGRPVAKESGEIRDLFNRLHRNGLPPVVT